MTQKQSVLTASNSKAYVEGGLSVAIVSLGQRAGLVINLAASKAEGAGLDSSLLAISEVLR